MAVFGQGLGQLSGNTEADLKRIADYISQLREEIEVNDTNIKRRLKALEEEG